MRKSREGHGKNWVHFVYKLDKLFRSIRVLDENSSVTRALHFLNLFELQTFFAFRCTIQSDFVKFQHFLSLFAIFQSFTDLFRELNDPEIEKHYKWTLKRLKLFMVSSSHPHIMCKKVERFTAKTRCTSCTNWTISFEVSVFRMKTHLLQRPALHFFKLIIALDFFAFRMHHLKPCHQLSTLCDIICYFLCIYWFVLS